VYTYLYQRIHSPIFVLVYIGVHGIGNSAVDYACGVCTVNVVIASCCCCFHGVISSSRFVVDFAIAGAVNGSITGSAFVVMCFRLVDSRYAATCDNIVGLLASTLLVVFSTSTGGTDLTPVSTLFAEALEFCFFASCSSHVFMVLKKGGER
jgi:hypothetical protein